MSLSTVKGSQKMEDTITSYSEESMWQEVKIKKQKKKQKTKNYFTQLSSLHPLAPFQREENLEESGFI